MKKRLSAINQLYEQILHLENLSEDEKDRRYAALMTEMENEFNIPMLRKAEFEEENRAIIALYRKISLSRSI